MKAITKSDVLDNYEKFILSASGWRKIFAISGNEEDSTTEVSLTDKWLFHLATVSFSEYLQNNNIATVVLGRDSRPTGEALEQVAFSALNSTLNVKTIGIASAPEIMAYAKKQKFAFMYISASHNPVGHNGIKFGLPTGGVLGIQDAKNLIAKFTEKVKNTEPTDFEVNSFAINYENKQNAFNDYLHFSKKVVSGYDEKTLQDSFFDEVSSAIKQYKNPITVICDFNGSARSVSIDKTLFENVGINFLTINDECGKIAHGIIPEGKNLYFCANEMKSFYKKSKTPVLGYMPDCDGDRGNIIYWDNKKNDAVVLQAQEVFAISVMAELSYLKYANLTAKPLAVAVNGPTSLRIEEIANSFGAKVFRAEVGEANVVELAAQLRQEGYEVRILGEGSNGGNITHPSSVRDPINTIFAILKILLFNNSDRQGLFQLWCEASGQVEKYKPAFSFSDVINTLPNYSTTPTQENRALLKIKTLDHGRLKAFYKQVFESEWAEKKEELQSKYGIFSYKAITTNGVKQIENIEDFSISGKGGLKIQFYNKDNNPIAFIWMRGSGTEPVFRVMADIKELGLEAEKDLVLWQGTMVKQADMLANKK